MADPYADLESLDQGDSDPMEALATLDQEAPQAPAEPAGSWWNRASSEVTDPEQWKRQALLAGRAAIQGVASLPLMVMDAGVGARNLVTGGDYEAPSSMWNKALDQFLPKPESKVEKVANFAESVLAGSKLPAPQAASRAPANFVPPSANPAASVLREARDAGYVVPPASASNSILAKGAESLAGKASTAQAASIKNQRVTNELVRKALSMGKDEPITAESLKSLRTAAGKVYEQIADAGEIRPDPRYIDDLAQLGKSADEIAEAFPGANVGATKQIGQLVDSLLQEKFDSRAALQYLRELRKDAAGNLSGINVADPAKQALGMAQREAASTLEDLIGRHLVQSGRGDLAESFGTARKVIAMSHSVENALNETTGNVVAGKLAQQLARGKPLSGELETVAKFARAFPKASKEVTESMPGASPLDWMAAITTAAAAHHPAGLAVVGARPAARWAALSPMAQRFLIDEASQGAVAPESIGLLPSAIAQGETQ